MAQRLAHDAPAANRFAASGAALFVGTLTANLLSYAFFLVLSRQLDASSLGAVGALVNLSVIATVPALGLQLVAARLVASERALSAPETPGGVGGHESRLLRAGMWLGLAVGATVLLLAPVLTRLLDIDTVAIIALAVAVVPMTCTFAAQGVLQGEERFGALAVVLALSGGSKVLAAVGAPVLGGHVSSVMWLYAAASLVVATAAWVALRGRPAERSVAPGPRRHLVRLVAAAVVPTSGLLFLASMDVLLARHHLSSAESGSYTVGALFGKAAFWGISFLATLFYPAMADASRRRGALVRALGVTAAAGLLGVLGASVLGRPLVVLVGGHGYEALAPDVWRFTAFGALLALVQVLAYAGLAAASLRMGVAMWAAGAAAVIAALSATSSLTGLVNVMVSCAGALVVAGLVIERRSLTTTP